MRSPWTRPVLGDRMKGHDNVRVRIKVAPATSGGGAWIVLTPLDDLAKVSGTCSPAERRQIQTAYSERLTFEVGPVLSDDLAPGSYAAQSLEAVGLGPSMSSRSKGLRNDPAAHGNPIRLGLR